MTSVDRRLSALENKISRVRRSEISDDEIVSALESRRWTQDHIGALFKIVEPGLLGMAIVKSAAKRRNLLVGKFGPEPISPMGAMLLVVAAGRDIACPHEHALEFWRMELIAPPGELTGARSGSGADAVWDAKTAMIRRLFNKHGVRCLESAADALAEARGTAEESLLDLLIPRVTVERWNRMIAVTSPLEDPIERPVPLWALSSDGHKFHERDIDGQERTLIWR